MKAEYNRVILPHYRRRGEPVPRDFPTAVYRVIASYRADGEEPPPGLKALERKIPMSKHRGRVRRGEVARYHGMQGLAKDPEKRFYLPGPDEPARVAMGAREGQFLASLLSGIKIENGLVFVSNGREIPFEKWLDALTSNRRLTNSEKELFRRYGSNGRDIGLGSTNERRVAYVLAKIADAKKLRGFFLCGEAGQPIKPKKLPILSH